MLDHIKIRRTALRKQEPLPSWKWASQEVDYSQAGNYDTPYKGMFDPDLMPFWKLPLEDMEDMTCREVAVVKPARAGFSENFLLTKLRFNIARNPEPTIYVTGSMDIAKGFFDRRVCRGMSLSKETAREYRNAKVTGTEIQFPSMDFRATWSTSDTATKSDGWACVLADEVSLWREFSVDGLRRRTAAYPFHHIAFGGSIDPTRKGDPYDDPIVKLYEESDKRIWFMNDGDGEFTFEFAGLKWPEECREGHDWNLQKVAELAYYQTPNGVRIDEKDRMKIVRSGYWKATAEGIRRGYKVTAPMVPFADCSFGELAKRFLSAKNRGVAGDGKVSKGDPMRVYWAENWAVPHHSKKLETTEEELADRVLDYQYGTKASDHIEIYKDIPNSIFATVDVQKDHTWIEVRQWFAVNGGDSALVLFQRCEDWPELFKICKENGVERIYCDAAYALRQEEVYAVASRTPGFIPVIDNAKLQGLYKRETIDPYEGTRRQGTSNLITRYVINPNLFRHKTIELMRGETDQNWFIPRGTPMEYMSQVTAESYIAGEWRKLRRDNHAWDTEVMQTFAATRARILNTYHENQQPEETD